MGDGDGNADGATNTAETTTEAMTENNVDNKTAETPEEVISDTPAEVVDDSPRAKFRNRFKDSHPDLDTENQDDFYNAADQQFNDLNDYKTRNTAANKSMIDSFNTRPEVGGFMKDIIAGAPGNVAYARNFGTDNMVPGEGDDDEGAWKEAAASYKQKQSDSEAYTQSISDNMELSAKEVQAFAQENNLDGEATAAFLTEVDNLVADAIKGTVKKATLTSLFRAMNADNEVADATAAAEVKGRNENIDAKKLEEAPTGDGLPKVSSTTEEKEPAPTVKQDAFSAAIEHQLNKKRI